MPARPHSPTTLGLQVHLADLAQVHAVAAGATAALPEGELAELCRYEPGRRRHQAHAGRLLARGALGGALDVPAAAVPITVDRYGRPRLRGSLGSRPHFAISHDRGLVVLAVARRRCGIDVEDAAEDDLREVADRFCGRGEHGGTRALWAAKESAAKAIGTGLRAGLRTIRFDGDPGVCWVGVTWRGCRVPLRTRAVDLGGRHLAVTAQWRAVRWWGARTTVHVWRPRKDGRVWRLVEADRAEPVTAALTAVHAALTTQLSTDEPLRGSECGS